MRDARMSFVLTLTALLFLGCGTAQKPQLISVMVDGRENAIASALDMSKKFNDLGCKNLKMGLFREKDGTRLLGACVEYGK